MNQSISSFLVSTKITPGLGRFVLPGTLALLFALACGGCGTCHAGKARPENPTCLALPAPECGVTSRETAPAPAPTVPRELSLHDALALAMKQNRALQAVRQERDIARGRVLESFSAALPHVTANGSYTRLDEVSSFEVAGQSISMGFTDNYSSDITVYQPLFHGGAIMATLKTAGLSSQMSAEQIRAATQGTIFLVSKSYYDVVLAERMVETTESAVLSAETHLGDLQNMKRAGVASDYDVLRAGVEVSNLRAELLRQKNALNLARASLYSAIGLPHDSMTTLTDKLETGPAQAAAVEPAGDTVENRPDMRIAELGVNIQAKALRIAQSRSSPQVDAFFTYKWANPDPHSSMSDEWGDAWVAGATASLPIFDGFGRIGKVSQEKARLRQARLNFAAAREQAQLEVKQAALSLRDAEELVHSQATNLAQAQEGLRLAEAGYKSGVRTEVEVMDARTALTRTQVILSQATYGREMARLNLRRATGSLEWKEDAPAGSGAETSGMPAVSGEPPAVQDK